MAINIFEGSRRIAVFVAIIWVGGWIFAAFQISPSVGVTYKVAGPGESPIRMTETCPSDSATEYNYKNTKKGTSARITLCFLARTADNGDRVIPFRVDPANGRWWGAGEYSTEVTEYKKRVESSFVIPQDDEKWIDGQWWPQLLKDIGQGALWACMGLLSFWALTWITGWIVRGFMGIPRGKDHKDTSVNATINQ